MTGICLKLRTVASCFTNFGIIPSPLKGLLLKLTNQQTLSWPIYSVPSYTMAEIKHNTDFMQTEI